MLDRVSNRRTMTSCSVCAGVTHTSCLWGLPADCAVSRIARTVCPSISASLQGPLPLLTLRRGTAGGQV